MKLGSILAMIVALPASAGTVHWTFSESTTGKDIHWVSSTTTDPQADQIDYIMDIKYVGVDIVFLGVEWGPYNVTTEIDPALLHGEDIVNGPAPFIMLNEPIEADGDSDGTIDVAAHMLAQVNGKGRGQLDITNVFLGSVNVDMGWPFGWQNVQIVRIYMDGEMYVTEIYLPCPADINGDGMVGVNDVLAVIDQWGVAGGPSDVNGDGIVDVGDLLAVVGTWGPC